MALKMRITEDVSAPLTNLTRAQQAKRALTYYLGHPDKAAAVCDLLCDLRHYCDANELDFGALDHLAHGNYIAELMEAAGR